MEWWVSMPKVELHAHLNGSIRDSTLLLALFCSFNQFPSPSLFFFLVALSHSPARTPSSEILHFFLHRELARALGDKGVIDFSQVEHVILKSMLSMPFCFLVFQCTALLSLSLIFTFGIHFDA